MLKKRLFSLFLSIVLLMSVFSPHSIAISQEATYTAQDSSLFNYYRTLSNDNNSVESVEVYTPDSSDLSLYGEKNAATVTYSNGEESLVFQIPLDNSSIDLSSNSKIALNYINVELVGDGLGNLKIKLWAAEPLQDTNLTCVLYYGTCRDEKPQNVHKRVSNISSVGGILNPAIINDSIKTTKYFMVELYGRYLGHDNIQWQSYNLLFNKKASKYPSYTCSLSNQLCVKPYYSNFAVTPVAERVSWEKPDRDRYIKYFNETYNNGKAPWDWEQYQVHHIRPRKFGGTNIYSNLIPIPKDIHYKFNGWWNNY